MLLGGSVLAQGSPLIIKRSGSQYAFTDDQDPNIAVLVAVGGIEVQHGTRRLLGDTLVVLLDTRVSDETDADDARGQVLPSARILEVYVDGNVSVEDGDEQVAGATAVHIDNRTGLVTLLDGSWRSGLGDKPVVVRFEVMRQFNNGRHEIEGATFTTCDYAHAHWGIDSPWAILEPTEAGRILKTSANVAHVGGVPLLPLPAFHLNVDRQRPPLRRVSFGTSTRFGTEINTLWGGDASAAATDVGSWFNSGPVEADWELELDNYSSRGVFVEPSWTYNTGSSRGRFLTSRIHDSNSKNHLDQPIEDKSRGRVDLEHRTRIDDQQTVDVEVSYLSDRGFMQEYYEQENRTEKPQETYVNYRNVKDNKAISILGRSRLNDWDTQVEYLPQVERRATGEVMDVGPFDDASMSSREFVSNARLLDGEPSEGTPEPPAGSQTHRSTRVGSRRSLTVPFDVGEDRVTVTGAYDLTGFSRSEVKDSTVAGGRREGDEATGRYAVFGGASWSRTYSGVDGDFTSDIWNMDGVRQIVEPFVGYNSVLELNRRPDDLIQIDNVETLDKLQLFNLGLRHRVQTHQNGRMVTVLDNQVSVPIFTNEERDNGGDSVGNVLADSVWKPGADIWGLRDATLRVRATLDPNDGWSPVTSYSSYSTRFLNQGQVTVGHAFAEHVSETLITGVEWELTPKWSGALFAAEDLRRHQSERKGILLRQRAHCWIIDIELSQRRADTITGSSNQEEQISFRFSPSVLADPEETLLQRLGNVGR